MLQLYAHHLILLGSLISQKSYSAFQSFIRTLFFQNLLFTLASFLPIFMYLWVTQTFEKPQSYIYGAVASFFVSFLTTVTALCLKRTVPWSTWINLSLTFLFTAWSLFYVDFTPLKLRFSTMSFILGGYILILGFIQKKSFLELTLGVIIPLSSSLWKELSIKLSYICFALTSLNSLLGHLFQDYQQYLVARNSLIIITLCLVVLSCARDLFSKKVLFDRAQYLDQRSHQWPHHKTKNQGVSPEIKKSFLLRFSR